MPEAPQRRGHASAIRLQAAVGELLAEVDRLPADLINWKPAEGVWSIMDILCHVEEFVPYWTRQAVSVVRHPGSPGAGTTPTKTGWRRFTTLPRGGWPTCGRRFDGPRASRRTCSSI